jgi:hypothetical protein
MRFSERRVFNHKKKISFFSKIVYSKFRTSRDEQFSLVRVQNHSSSLQSNDHSRLIRISRVQSREDGRIQNSQLINSSNSQLVVYDSIRIRRRSHFASSSRVEIRNDRRSNNLFKLGVGLVLPSRENFVFNWFSVLGQKSVVQPSTNLADSKDDFFDIILMRQVLRIDDWKVIRVL